MHNRGQSHRGSFTFKGRSDTTRNNNSDCVHGRLRFKIRVFSATMRVILSAPSGRRFSHTEARVGGWEDAIDLKLEDTAMIMHTGY